jgi:glycosyltransferase involved in cell wall biosynthesis
MKMKTNILYIFHVSFLGGGSLCLLNLVKELDKENYNPIVLLKNWGPVCEELKRVGATIIIEPTLNTVPYNRPLFEINSIRQIIPMMLSIKKVKYWIKKTDAQIVHINTMMMYPYAIPGFTLSRKVIIHIREHWPIDQHFLQLKFARKIIDKYTDLIISINKTSAEIINLPHKTEIIYDWIDFNGRDKFIDFKDIFGNDHEVLKVFLFLGGIQKTKGSLQIVKIFSENIKSKDARLLFVGSDSKQISYQGIKGVIKKLLHLFNYLTYSDKIKKIAQQDDRIVFIPTTNQVKSLFEQAYCTVVFPTIPHAIIPIAESIYLGKPIISAETPEALEYSNKGKGATLFKMNDEDDFINKLIHISQNKEKIYNKSYDNSNFVKKLFSLEKNSSKLNRLYLKLLEY